MSNARFWYLEFSHALRTFLCVSSSLASLICLARLTFFRDLRACVPVYLCTLRYLTNSVFQRLLCFTYFEIFVSITFSNIEQKTVVNRIINSKMQSNLDIDLYTTYMFW